MTTVPDAGESKDEARMKNRGRMVGEFLLIVIGVLVAFMVEAALDERQDDALRDEYYSRVRADVEADKLAVARVVSRRERNALGTVRSSLYGIESSLWCNRRDVSQDGDAQAIEVV